jgi:hypothetical protein
MKWWILELAWIVGSFRIVRLLRDRRSSRPLKDLPLWLVGFTVLRGRPPADLRTSMEMYDACEHELYIRRRGAPWVE